MSGHYQTNNYEPQNSNFTGIKSLIERSNFGNLFLKDQSFEPLPFMDYSLFQESYGILKFIFALKPLKK